MAKIQILVKISKVAKCRKGKLVYKKGVNSVVNKSEKVQYSNEKTLINWDHLFGVIPNVQPQPPPIISV